MTGDQLVKDAILTLRFIALGGMTPLNLDAPKPLTDFILLPDVCKAQTGLPPLSCLCIAFF